MNVNTWLECSLNFVVFNFLFWTEIADLLMFDDAQLSGCMIFYCSPIYRLHGIPTSKISHSGSNQHFECLLWVWNTLQNVAKKFQSTWVFVFLLLNTISFLISKLKKLHENEFKLLAFVLVNSQQLALFNADTLCVCDVCSLE